MSIILIASFTFKSWHDMHRWLKHCKAEITHFAAIKSWLVFHLAKKKKREKKKENPHKRCSSRTAHIITIIRSQFCHFLDCDYAG